MEKNKEDMQETDACKGSAETPSDRKKEKQTPWQIGKIIKKNWTS